MDNHTGGRGWPGDLGSDYTAAGMLTRWAAFFDGLRTNRRGRNRAARMLLALGLVIGVVLVVGLVLAVVR